MRSTLELGKQASGDQRQEGEPVREQERTRGKVGIGIAAAVAGLALAVALGYRGDPTALRAEEPPPPQEGDTQPANVEQTSPPIDSHGEPAWPTEGNEADVTYKVTPKKTFTGGQWVEEKTCDFHIFVPSEDGDGKVKPAPKKKGGQTTGTPSAPANSGWKAEKKDFGGGQLVSFYAENCDQNKLPSDGMTFTIKVKKTKDGWPEMVPCALVLTNDGGVPTKTPGGGIPGFGTEPGPITGSNVVYYWPRKAPRKEGEKPSDGTSTPPPIGVPVASNLVEPPVRDLVLVAGGEFTVSVPEVWASSRFNVLTSTQLDPDLQDASKSGIAADSAPIPTGWQVTAFTTGTFDPQTGKGSIELSRDVQSGAPPIADFYLVVRHVDHATGETIEDSHVVHLRVVASLADFDGDGVLNESDGARFDAGEN